MKTLILGVVLSVLAIVPFSTQESAEGATPPPQVIATFDRISNGFVINHSILNKRFQDGSKIESFSIQKDGEDFFLIRRGMDAKKQFRSEAFRLQPVKKEGLKLVLPLKLKWYTVCTSFNCWCHKVSNSCECAEGGNCTFGTVPIGDDIEIVVLG